MQHKVFDINGIIKCVMCITCPPNDCTARKHRCNNEIPFPEEEAHDCVRANKEQYIKFGDLETCRKESSCGKNEIPTECTCYENRRCHCPLSDHYRNNVHECKKCGKCSLKNPRRVQKKC